MIEDLREYKMTFQKEYGWYLIAKNVATWTSTNYYDIMSRPASEVIGVMIVMRAEKEIMS